MDTTQYLQLLKKELMIAMGCTEPAAAALAGAKAALLLDLPVENIEIYASRDMVKNAMGVGLPNCSLRGIQAAVALGVAKKDVDKGLGILSEISEGEKARAQRYAEERKIALTLVPDVPPVYISVIVSHKEHTAEATISGEHNRFVVLKKDANVLEHHTKEQLDTNDREDNSLVSETIALLSLSEILSTVETIDTDDFLFVLQGALTNKEIALHAMHAPYGLQVGMTMGKNLPNPPHTLDEAYHLGSSYAAAASDARMAGCPLPVVINSGSGNQGITVSVPLLVLGEFLNVSQKTLIKALCVSHLVALVLTAKKDRLSALCGAFTAAIGTACGLVYLQGGDLEAMDRAVNNMVGNLTGIICDGAKETCALKIYSCVDSAILSVKLALQGLSPHDEPGIVGKDALQSFAYLTQISHEGMEQTDRTILSIMLGKQEGCER